jgi:tetratricopeptide (TPR) repeat protein
MNILFARDGATFSRKGLRILNVPRKKSGKRNSRRPAIGSRRADQLFAVGLQCHQAGRLVEAEKAYRLALQAAPNNAPVLNNLGMIAPPGEKAALFHKALELRPNYIEAHINLAGFLAAQGDADGAISHYRLALLQRPDWAEGHFALGRLLQSRGRLLEAAECLQRCVNLKPDFVPAVFSLGCVFALAGLSLGSKDADNFAITWFRRTVELAPDLEDANFHLAKLLEDAGRFAEARPFRDRVSRPLPLEIAPAPEHRRIVLILCTPSSANTPFRKLLPERVNSLITWHIDYATDEQQEALPPYDVAFYTVGNPDWDGECFDRAVSFARQRHRPMLNAPERIARTRRDLLPQLLAGIPDVVVAPIVRLSREEIKGAGLQARLEREGLAWPLIVRPFGHQGGVGVSLARAPADLEAMSFEEAEFYYFIQYWDYRSPDGYYRKYRSVFVDRQPYHYHLAISRDWLVHYFSADMLSEPWKREEERQFLEHSTEALGARAATAVAAIGQRLDLDYAGIDYTVLPDGRVLVFEGNATMSVYFPEEPEYAYKTDHVQAILTGFEEMMERKIQAPRAPKPSRA